MTPNKSQRQYKNLWSVKSTINKRQRSNYLITDHFSHQHHLYMGLCRFLYNENFYYFPEGALEVCPYLLVPRVKREPKYSLIEFMEAAKAMKNWVSIETCSRLLK